MARLWMTSDGVEHPSLVDSYAFDTLWQHRGWTRYEVDLDAASKLVGGPVTDSTTLSPEQAARCPARPVADQNEATTEAPVEDEAKPDDKPAPARRRGSASTGGDS